MREKKISAKLHDSNNSELMAISALDRDGDELIIKGKIYGAMPMKAKLRPEDARELLKLLNLRILVFALSLPFRRSSSAVQARYQGSQTGGGGA